MQNANDSSPETAALSDEALFHGSDVAAELLANRSIERENDPLLAPIPEHAGEFPEDAPWKQIEVREGHEHMVPLGAFSENRHIFTSSVYFGEHSNSPYIIEEQKLDGALATLFVREDVARMLTRAQQELPERHYLMVMDGYRSLEVQQSLYDHYFSKLRDQHPDWSEEALSTETQNYVSLPAPATDRPWVSPHHSGGSVDTVMIRLPEDVDAKVKELEIQIDKLEDPDSDEGYVLEMEKLMLIRQYGEMLDFGTQFDHGGDKAGLRWYEDKENLTPKEIEARDNRRILYNAMKAAGFEALASEWWHYNSPKSQMGASTAGNDYAEYGSATLSADNLEHENIRKAHFAGVTAIQEALMGGKPVQLRRGPGESGYESDVHYLALNERVIKATGDFRLTHMQDAEIIAPPDDHHTAA